VGAVERWSLGGIHERTASGILAASMPNLYPVHAVPKRRSFTRDTISMIYLGACRLIHHIGLRLVSMG